MYDRYVAQLSLYKHDSFCWRFLQIVRAEIKKKTHKIAIAAGCYFLQFCHFVPSHWCIALQKRTHDRTAVSLKSKTDFLKIQEICEFWLKHDFFFTKFFSAKNVLLCTVSLELKTDSRTALWFRFYN